MELKDLHCPVCGSTSLNLEKDGFYHCPYCQHQFVNTSLQNSYDLIKNTFDKAILEESEKQVANSRFLLYEATHAKNISKKQVEKCSHDLRKLLPDDFQAVFYETVNQNSALVISKYLDDLTSDDLIENKIYVTDIIEFLLACLELPFYSSLLCLIEKAAKLEIFSNEQYLSYVRRLQEEAEKLNDGIYSPFLPRDVFIAYSSQDIAKVNEIVNYLESNDITCYYAYRNLRHGLGAVENYELALEDAMKHCRCFVFVSSRKSRQLSCDALKIELPYVRDNLPNVKRIGFLITSEVYDATTSDGAKMLLKEFFAEQEYCRELSDLLKRVLDAVTKSERIRETKFCLNCGKECEKEIVFCPICGGDQFVNSYEEYTKRKKATTTNSSSLFSKPKPTTGINEQDFRYSIDSDGTIVIHELLNKNLLEIVLPEGVKTIDDGAFKGSRILSVSFPKSLRYIGKEAFMNCTYLNKVNFHKNIKLIDEKAFYNCTNLMVSLPNYVQMIGSDAFEDTGFWLKQEKRAERKKALLIVKPIVSLVLSLALWVIFHLTFGNLTIGSPFFYITLIGILLSVLLGLISLINVVKQCEFYAYYFLAGFCGLISAVDLPVIQLLILHSDSYALSFGIIVLVFVNLILILIVVFSVYYAFDDDRKIILSLFALTFAFGIAGGGYIWDYIVSNQSTSSEETQALVDRTMDYSNENTYFLEESNLYLEIECDMSL